MKLSLSISAVLLFLALISGFSPPLGGGDKNKKAGVEASCKVKLNDIVVRFQVDVYEVEKCRILMKEAADLSKGIIKFIRGHL